MRYYGERFEPAQFGWWIRSLNFLRYWLETHIQWLVLKSLLKTHGVPKDQGRQYRLQFKKDVAVEVANWKYGQPLIEKQVEDIPTAYRQDGTPKSQDFATGFASYVAPGRSKKYGFRDALLMDTQQERVPPNGSEQQSRPELPTVEVVNPSDASGDRGETGLPRFPKRSAGPSAAQSRAQSAAFSGRNEDGSIPVPARIEPVAPKAVDRVRAEPTGNAASGDAVESSGEEVSGREE